jgi:hypothetical protein
MHSEFCCPYCRAPLHPASSKLDFFCRPCRMAVSIIDEQWAEVLRPTDMSRTLVPLSECRMRVSGSPQQGVATEPLPHPA